MSLPSAQELGFLPLPGSGRRYVEVATGEIRSRRFVEDARRGGAGTFRVEQAASLDARARAAGFSSGREFEQTRRSQRYRRFASLYAEDRQERTPARSFSDPASDFNVAYQAAVDAGWQSEGWRRNPALRDPHGPLAHLLVLVGLRSEGDEWDVGDSPGAAGLPAAA